MVMVLFKQSILFAVTELILRSDTVTLRAGCTCHAIHQLQNKNKNKNKNQRRRTKEKMNEKEQYKGRRKQFLHHLPCLNDTRYVSHLLKK